MANVDALGKEIVALLVGVGKDIHEKFSREDRADLENYAKNVAALSLRLRTEQNPSERAKIQDNLDTFLNATRLMIARYELMAANAAERAAVAALKLATGAVLKVVLAAL
jgi:hypothetical protein